MKSLVINLGRRADRLSFFYENNSKALSDIHRVEAVDGKALDIQKLHSLGFDTSKGWRDPIRKTKLTHGEVGCFISHWKVWEECVKLGEPVLVLEDDAVVTQRFSEGEVEGLLETYDLVYLARREMEPESTRVIDDVLEVPHYPYWTSAYALTPRAAEALLRGGGNRNIIPADEYLPRMLGEIGKVAAYRVNVVNTRTKGEGVTDVDPQSEEDYFIDFPIHVITAGTDENQCHRLLTSAQHYDIRVTNLGLGVEWGGTDMTGPGGGHKINLVREYVNRLEDHEVVLFMDGYDTFFAGDLETIVRRYFGFGRRVLFAAERVLWPDPTMVHPLSPTPYRHLNSGLFIGEAGTLKAMMAEPIENSADDQLYYQRKFLSGQYDVGLDYECYIFQCHDPEVGKKDDLLHNPVTRCCPRVYHGNGGPQAKELLDSLYKTFDFAPTAYLRVRDVQVLDRDMLLVDFMTPSMCEDMIRLADEHGEWGSLSYDKFPAMEIRLKKLGLWDQMQEHWKKVLFPVIEKHWYPMEMYDLRDAFVMRYSLDTQTSLRLHTDASLVTGSVKLNDDYLGADLYFPRQNVSNRDIPVGKCILFPGQVTHGHTCTELTHGVKYSLTMWTSRYRGDYV